MYCCRKSTPKVISFYLILPLTLFPFLLFPYSPPLTSLDSLPAREGKDYALFFAASNYQDQTLSTLKNAITDAERIAGLLKEHYGFEVEVVKDPTYELIEQKLYEYKALFEDKSWSSNSQLLIFFAACYELRGDQVICNWEAKGYRLPTEAEWEYVASGGGQAIRYAWGSKKVVGNVADISYKKESPTSTKQLFSGLDDGFGTKGPVDTFEQGSLGFYNLSGNVWEWCWDWHSNTYYSTSKGDRNPKGPETGTHRVYRGGGWNWAPKITISYRAEINPSAKYNNIGFRLSRSVGGL